MENDFTINKNSEYLASGKSLLIKKIQSIFGQNSLFKL